MSKTQHTLALIAIIALILGVTAVDAAEATSSADYSSYVVQRGDTLIEIAIARGLDVNELAAANDISWDSWVYVGQVLSVPRGASAADGAAAADEKTRRVGGSARSCSRYSRMDGVSVRMGSRRYSSSLSL
jgi:LysM repeat protein